MSMITTKDDTQIYYKDWGTGQPVVFSHGCPLNADAWDEQLVFLADNGYRAIAHDRRGHGRSSQPWNGNEMEDLNSLCQCQNKLSKIICTFVGDLGLAPRRWDVFLTGSPY